MPRLQIELTSARPDGTWTWRVAGARQPRGTVEGALLPSGSQVGDVLRVEADVELEGMVVTSVLAAPSPRREPERLELLASSAPFEGVTTRLVSKGGRPTRGGTWDGEPSGPRGPRGARGRGAPGGDRADGGPGDRGRRDRRSPARAGRGDEPGAREREEAATGNERPGRGGHDRERTRDGERTRDRSRGERRPRPEGAAPSRPGAERRPGRPGEGERGRPRERGHGSDRAGATRTEAPPRPKRLSPATLHRDALLESLPAEQRPVAQQLLQGGIPAVRRALNEQNNQLRAAGQAEIASDAILTLAEELLPRVKVADWRDRADAAAADVDEIPMRDLRSVVAGADAARDDESRVLATTLREALHRREEKGRQQWLDEIGRCLDESRLVRALRVSSRPPDPRTRVPSELATRLSEGAGAALSGDASPERWMTVLEAVVESPVRRSVKPAGLPADAPPEVVSAARQASGRIPALASMLGIDLPPPPGPLRRPPARPVRRGPAPPRPPAPRAEAPTQPPAPTAEAPTPPASVIPAPAPDAGGTADTEGGASPSEA